MIDTMAKLTEKPLQPLFKKHSIEEIHELTEYSLYYLLDIRSGKRPLTRTFKKLCTAVLNVPESELFMEEIADDNRE